jgi:hypothetical protein
MNQVVRLISAAAERLLWSTSGPKGPRRRKRRRVPVNPGQRAGDAARERRPLGVLGPRHRRSPAANPSRGVFGSRLKRRCDPARRPRPRPPHAGSRVAPAHGDAPLEPPTSAPGLDGLCLAKRVGSRLQHFEAPKSMATAETVNRQNQRRVFGSLTRRYMNNTLMYTHHARCFMLRPPPTALRPSRS